jgi:biotin carboxyl carrier protein
MLSSQGEEEVLELWVGGSHHHFRRPMVRRWLRSGAASQQAGTVVTPMPGRVVKVGGRGQAVAPCFLPKLGSAAATCVPARLSFALTTAAMPCHFHTPYPSTHSLPPFGRQSHARATPPLPPRPLQVFVRQGEAVSEGQPLVVVEAMKMEHTVRAPCAGTLAELHSFPEAQIQEGHVLAVVAPQEAAAATA